MNRRFLALLLALTFVFSVPVSVSASVTTGEGIDFTTISGSSAVASTGSWVVTGGGDVVYVDTEVYSVVLPTSKTFDFKLDPMGLLSVTTSGGVEIGDLDGGKIIGNQNPAPFINNSSVPILLSVTASALTSGGGVSFKTNKADVTTGSANTVALYIAASVDNMNLTSESSYGFSETELGFVLTTQTPINLSFALPRAQYLINASYDALGTVLDPGEQIDGEFELKVVSGTGHGNTFQVGGYINSKADWSGFVSTGSLSPKDSIGVSLVFGWEKDANDDTRDVANPMGAYGLVSNATINAFTSMGVTVVRQTYTSSGFINPANNTIVVGDYTGPSWNRVSASSYNVGLYIPKSETIESLGWNNNTVTLAANTWSYDSDRNRLTINAVAGSQIATASTNATAKIFTVVTDKGTYTLKVVFAG